MLNMPRGKFITIEGIDGAGKSTHIPTVLDALARSDIKVVATREPGGTPLGERLRELLLHEKMHLETEALLMFASRREHLDQVIEPALARGDWVLSDRFTDASFAYQSGGRGLDGSKLDILERWVCAFQQPDLTLLFDVPPEVARTRLGTSNLDKFEQEKEEFFSAVRQEYHRRAKQFPARFVIIDATVELDAVASAVRTAIARFLTECKLEAAENIKLWSQRC
jgi:dTMP kinase